VPLLRHEEAQVRRAAVARLLDLALAVLEIDAAHRRVEVDGRALELREMTYGWAVEMVTRGAMRGYRVLEVPVSYHPRIGVSKISGTLRGSIGAAWCILSGIVKHRLREAANRAEPGRAT